ncbi:MAG: glycosyltransferase family 2 protein [Chloroflexi bacterium]|nr:MAG: glycosyltransferase family 2 protein [Chloroflexota bacterium]
MPAYNEEQNIEGALEDACEVAASVTPAWEVIVVDDGSKDTTAQRVTRVSQQQDRVRLISFPENRGYGVALRAGFHAARGDLIFYTDSDRQFDLSELRFFLPVMDRTDVAIGFRVYRPTSPSAFGSTGTTRCCVVSSPGSTTGWLAPSSGRASGTSTARSSFSAVRCWKPSISRLPIFSSTPKWWPRRGSGTSASCKRA